jgi:hypothetical protein
LIFVLDTPNFFYQNTKTFSIKSRTRQRKLANNDNNPSLAAEPSITKKFPFSYRCRPSKAKLVS